MAYHHDNFVEYGNGKKTLSSYILGFVLSMALTIGAFVAVSMKAFAHTQLYVLVLVLAISQLLVQSICFLRLNFSEEGRWNSLPFLFILAMIAVLIIGTIWIMYCLNYNMFNY